jgi:hypothetical protein
VGGLGHRIRRARSFPPKPSAGKRRPFDAQIGQSWRAPAPKRPVVVGLGFRNLKRVGGVAEGE